MTACLDKTGSHLKTIERKEKTVKKERKGYGVSVK